ncbi:MAG: hypothetical protein KDM64_05750 [Verrucomicrobiae bacterium]|nr:hypothetical protein [Verrucomicrobiae bacterium]
MKTKRNPRFLLTTLLGAAALVATAGISHAQSPALGQYSGRLPFWGAFPDDTHLTNGFLCLKVTARQAISGTVAYGGYVYRLRGALVGGVLAPTPLTKRNAPDIEIEITSSDEFGISGQVRRVGAPDWIVFDGGHALRPLEKWSRANPFPFEGLGTAGMEQWETDWVEYTDPITMETYGQDEWPEFGLSRHGYALIKMTNTGIARYKGQLPDGTKFTGSTCATAFRWDEFSPWMLELWVYAITNRGAGSVVGPMGTMDTHMGDPDAPAILGGNLRWYPDPATAPKRTWLVVEGSEYNSPLEGDRILEAPSGLLGNLLQDPAARLGTTPDGIDAALSGPLSGAPAVTRPVTPYLATLTGTDDPNSLTISFKPKDGSYKFSFIHPGTGRKTTGYGVVVQWQQEWIWVDDGMGGFEELMTVPGFGNGVFVNKYRDRATGTTYSYPGWLVLEPNVATGS